MRPDPTRVPDFLLPLLPLAERWGIPDDGLRGELVRAASADELAELAGCFDDVPAQELEGWLTGPEARPDPGDEYVAISALLRAVHLAKVLLRKGPISGQPARG